MVSPRRGRGRGRIDLRSDAYGLIAKSLQHVSTCLRARTAVNVSSTGGYNPGQAASSKSPVTGSGGLVELSSRRPASARRAAEGGCSMRRERTWSIASPGTVDRRGAGSTVAERKCAGRHPAASLEVSRRTLSAPSFVRQEQMPRVAKPAGMAAIAQSTDATGEGVVGSIVRQAGLQRAHRGRCGRASTTRSSILGAGGPVAEDAGRGRARDARGPSPGQRGGAAYVQAGSAADAARAGHHRGDTRRAAAGETTSRSTAGARSLRTTVWTSRLAQSRYDLG